MHMGTNELLENTFLPYVRCVFDKCKVNPKSKYISIRKEQRFNISSLHDKISRAIANWNDSNSMIATEGVKLNFSNILNVIMDIKNGPSSRN